MAQKGLTAGRFYRIYNPAAVPIEDENLRSRFETKRDIDLAEIHDRMRQVGIDRAYRIIAVREQTAHDVEVPDCRVRSCNQPDVKRVNGRPGPIYRH